MPIQFSMTRRSVLVSANRAHNPSAVPHVSRINEVMHVTSIVKGQRGKESGKIDHDHSALGARKVRSSDGRIVGWYDGIVVQPLCAASDRALP